VRIHGVAKGVAAMAIDVFRKVLVSAALLAGLSATAFADPLADLLKKGGGSACFERVYDKAHLDKHPGQQTTAVRLSLQRDEDGSDAVIRVALSNAKGTNYIVGGCSWAAKANLDINDKPLIEAFKGPSGLNCYAMTSEDGSSAEEGGDFPIDLKDGKSILLYLPDGIAAWQSFDRAKSAAFLELGKEDRVFKLDATGTASCREMNDKLPWLL
jgi:hypothetical protein